MNIFAILIVQPRRVASPNSQIEHYLLLLFDALEPDDFYKTEELNKLPGTWADVYRPIPFIDAELGEASDWYLKFYVEGDYLSVHVLSANYDGYIH